MGQNGKQNNGRHTDLKALLRNMLNAVPIAFVLAGYFYMSRRRLDLAAFAFLYTMALFLLLSVLRKHSGTPKAAIKPGRFTVLICLLAVAAAAAYLAASRLAPNLQQVMKSLVPVLCLCAFLLCGAALLFRFISGSSAQKAMRAYNELCDPNPLLEECERRLAGRLNGVARQRWLFQKSSMLAALGRFESAEQVLSALLAKEQRLPDNLRAICCYNFAEVLLDLGKLEAAEDYHTKAALVSQSLSENMKQTMLGFLREQDGFLLYHKGDYEGARRIFMESGWDTEQNDDPKTLCTRVFHAYKLGLVLLKTGEAKLAREKLSFVARHGNRLYITTQAKEILG